MSGIFQQARSFVRQPTSNLANGRRKHEGTDADSRTVGENTNFRARLPLLGEVGSLNRPIFVFSPTDWLTYGSEL